VTATCNKFHQGWMTTMHIQFTFNMTRLQNTMTAMMKITIITRRCHYLTICMV